MKLGALRPGQVGHQPGLGLTRLGHSGKTNHSVLHRSLLFSSSIRQRKRNVQILIMNAYKSMRCIDNLYFTLSGFGGKVIMKYYALETGYE